MGAFVLVGWARAQEAQYYYDPNTGLYYDAEGNVIPPDYYDPYGQPVYEDLNPQTDQDPYDWTSPEYGDYTGTYEGGDWSDYGSYDYDYGDDGFSGVTDVLGSDWDDIDAGGDDW